VLTSDTGFPLLRNRSTARVMRRSIGKLNQIQQKRGMLMISGAIMSIDSDPRDNEQVNKSWLVSNDEARESYVFYTYNCDQKIIPARLREIDLSSRCEPGEMKLNITISLSFAFEILWLDLNLALVIISQITENRINRAWWSSNATRLEVTWTSSDPRARCPKHFA